MSPNMGIASDGIPTDKRIQWVVGQQLAGKTMYTRIMLALGAQVLNIGERIRQTTTPDALAHQPNPYAPSGYDQVVERMVVDAIHDFKLAENSTLLVIDSAPKNLSQLALVQEVAEISQIVIVSDDYDIRKLRAANRYRSDREMELFYRREQCESDWISYLMNVCQVGNIPIIYTRPVRFHARPRAYSEQEGKQ